MENVNAIEEIQSLEKKADEALRRKQEHLKAISEQARLSDHSEVVFARRSSTELMASGVPEVSSTVSNDGSHAHTAGLTLDDQIKLAQVRHELRDAAKMQYNILDLAKDELRQINAADIREQYIQSKIPMDVEDRMEHAKETYQQHEKEYQEHLLAENKEHQLKQEHADLKRAAFLANKVETAREL